MATPHFSDAELRCRCGCGRLPPQEFQDELESLRVDFEQATVEYERRTGKRVSPAMKLSSGWRCPDHNDEVSKTGRDGPHTKGAVDVLVYGIAAWLLLRCALIRSWFGIGVSQKGPRTSRFLHFDQLTERTRPWVWSY